MRLLRPVRNGYAWLRSKRSGRNVVFVTEQYPVFVPVRDRLSPLRQLIGWLECVGQRVIYLVDNASTYEPLREYLASTTHTVVRLDHNLGHRSPWLSVSVNVMCSGGSSCL